MKRLGWLAGSVVLVAGPALAAEHVVTMTDNAYAPAELSARVGDTIRFVKQDADWHNVFVTTTGFALDLGKQEEGAESILTLTTPGSFEVECVHHLPMLLTVEVAP